MFQLSDGVTTELLRDNTKAATEQLITFLTVSEDTIFRRQKISPTTRTFQDNIVTPSLAN